MQLGMSSMDIDQRCQKLVIKGCHPTAPTERSGNPEFSDLGGENMQPLRTGFRHPCRSKDCLSIEVPCFVQH